MRRKEKEVEGEVVLYIPLQSYRKQVFNDKGAKKGVGKAEVGEGITRGITQGMIRVSDKKQE